MSKKQVETKLTGKSLREVAENKYGIVTSNKSDEDIRTEIVALDKKMEENGALVMSGEEGEKNAYDPLNDPRAIGGKAVAGEIKMDGSFSKKITKLDESKFVTASDIRKMKRVQVKISNTAEADGNLPVKAGTNGLFVLIPRNAWVELPECFVEGLTQEVPLEQSTGEIDPKTGMEIKRITMVPRHPVQVLPLGVKPY